MFVPLLESPRPYLKNFENKKEGLALENWLTLFFMSQRFPMQEQWKDERELLPDDVKLDLINRTY